MWNALESWKRPKMIPTNSRDRPPPIVRRRCGVPWNPWKRPKMIPTNSRDRPASDCPEKMWSALESLEASKNDPYQQQGSPASDCPEKMWSALESLEASKMMPTNSRAGTERDHPPPVFPRSCGMSWNQSLGSLPTAGLVPSGIAHLRLSQEDVECPGIPGDIQK
ncbi:hypothetical protein DUI87_04792 [Hirundo rustica rustica]|uniref:Uncharacterized protein n=1 Tax=Hirundo rustica rustica TaxID=333673 RepID=A0A3M0L0G9_HIRRU|nr:hypothetical protein DUI87_04792 [Hirundo rustica rustica]